MCPALWQRASPGHATPCPHAERFFCSPSKYTPSPLPHSLPLLGNAPESARKESSQGSRGPIPTHPNRLAHRGFALPLVRAGKECRLPCGRGEHCLVAFAVPCQVERQAAQQHLKSALSPTEPLSPFPPRQQANGWSRCCLLVFWIRHRGISHRRSGLGGTRPRSGQCALSPQTCSQVCGQPSMTLTCRQTRV